MEQIEAQEQEPRDPTTSMDPRPVPLHRAAVDASSHAEDSTKHAVVWPSSQRGNLRNVPGTLRTSATLPLRGTGGMSRTHPIPPVVGLSPASGCLGTNHGKFSVQRSDPTAWGWRHRL